jgi:hypothetical protein
MFVHQDARHHDAILPWVHQVDPDFVLFENPVSDKLWTSYDNYATAVRAVITSAPIPTYATLNRGVPHNNSNNSPHRRLDQLHPNSNSVRKERQSLVKAAGQYMPKATSSEYIARMKANNERHDTIEVRLLDRWSILRYCNQAQV